MLFEKKIPPELPEGPYFTLLSALFHLFKVNVGYVFGTAATLFAIIIALRLSACVISATVLTRLLLLCFVHILTRCTPGRIQISQ